MNIGKKLGTFIRYTCFCVTLIFIACKIDGLVAFSWWVVFSPTLGLFATVGAMLFLADLFEKISEKHNST